MKYRKSAPSGHGTERSRSERDEVANYIELIFINYLSHFKQVNGDLIK